MTQYVKNSSKYNSLLNSILYILGGLLHVIAYGSIEPVLISLIFGIGGLILLKTLSRDFFKERLVYLQLFSIGWFMAGVSAIYYKIYNDPLQNDSDASSFYELASGGAAGLSLENIKVMTEGSGAVVLWRYVYEFFSWCGFYQGMYIGILVNILSVSFSAVMGINMVRLIYGYDQRRERLFLLLFSFCGLFWLFSAIHMRDGVVLLGITALSYFWTRYLVRLSIFNLVTLVISNSFASLFFIYLRAEFAFVPITMGFAGIFSLLIFHRGGIFDKFIVWFIAVVGMMIFGIVFLLNYNLFMESLLGGNEGYGEFLSDSAASNSLGMSMILSQPLFIRLILGSAYLFVFPIPFWIGFYDDSVYALFKSCNVVFFYFLTPLFLLSILDVVKQKKFRTPSLMFLLMLAVGFTLAIAGTSLETRHFGAFLVPLFVFSLLARVDTKSSIQRYKMTLFSFLSVISVVHIAWLVVKS